MLGAYAPPVEAETRFEGAQMIETLKTPVGTLTGIWQFADTVAGIPHAVKHAVTNYEEMKIFQYAVNCLDTDHPGLDHAFFRHLDNLIGDDGIATVSLSNTPLMYLIEMAWGLENTYYLLNDYREDVEEILEGLHRSLKRHAEVPASSTAEVVIQYENTSSALLSPKMFLQR